MLARALCRPSSRTLPLRTRPRARCGMSAVEQPEITSEATAETSDAPVDPLLNSNDESRFNRIADLEPMKYERLRTSLAKAMDIRVSVLDQERERRRRPDAAPGLNLEDPEG